MLQSHSRRAHSAEARPPGRDCHCWARCFWRLLLALPMPPTATSSTAPPLQQHCRTRPCRQPTVPPHFCFFPLCLGFAQEMGHSVDVLVLADNVCQTNEALVEVASGLRVALKPDMVNVHTVKITGIRIQVGHALSSPACREPVPRNSR